MNPVGLGSVVDWSAMFTQGALAATSQDAGMGLLKKSLNAATSVAEDLVAQLDQAGHLSVYA
jgi:hypothetical protein